ncbi:hypothetical protein D3C86_2134350 [compost metagenome]
MMLLAGEIPLFVTTDVKVRVSPLTTELALWLLTMLTLGAETLTAVVLEPDEPVKILPSGNV